MKGAFRAAAKKYHPDVPGTGDEARFMAAREAADTLSTAIRTAQRGRGFARALERPWKLNGLVGLGRRFALKRFPRYGAVLFCFTLLYYVMLYIIILSSILLIQYSVA